jgi:uncharacterized protein (TIGR02996 family)
MRPIHPELKALLDTVCERPTDATAKLVLADWLDENGYCGESMRYAVARDKCPLILIPGAGHCWLNAIKYRRDKNRFDRRTKVPHVLFHWLGLKEQDGYSCLGNYWVAWDKPSKAWIAFIVAFGEAYKEGKIGRKRKTKETTA